ncbi:hypothetical protein FBZ86_1579, partial [Gluconacetobacter diazotrophicus]
MMAFSHYDVALLARALWMTVVLSVAGGLAGLAGGTALACLRMARGPVFAPARFLAAGYVQVVRRVPFIVTLYQAVGLGAAVVMSDGDDGVYAAVSRVILRQLYA